jgi:hypothetical protein
MERRRRRRRGRRRKRKRKRSSRGVATYLIWKVVKRKRRRTTRSGRLVRGKGRRSKKERRRRRGRRRRGKGPMPSVIKLEDHGATLPATSKGQITDIQTAHVSVTDVTVGKSRAAPGGPKGGTEGPRTAASSFWPRLWDETCKFWTWRAARA